MSGLSPLRVLRRRASDFLLLPLVLLAVLGEDVVWHGCLRLLGSFGRFTLICALRAWLARLPPFLALPLFLVPETASQGGVAVSGWMAWEGHTRTALIILILAKTLATLGAIWIYRACEPSLLRVRWFARAHHWVSGGWDAAKARLRGAALRCWQAVIPGRPAANLRLLARFRRLRRRFSRLAHPRRSGGLYRPG